VILVGEGAMCVGLTVYLMAEGQRVLGLTVYRGGRGLACWC
jgi:hypothetical protein